MVVDNDWLKVEKGDKASCEENQQMKTKKKEGGSVFFVVLATTFFVGGDNEGIRFIITNLPN